jgi:hypothetical protein
LRRHSDQAAYRKVSADSLPAVRMAKAAFAGKLLDGGGICRDLTQATPTRPGFVNQQAAEEFGSAADQAEAFQKLVAYSGLYRIESPDRFVTAIDVAWFEPWLGSEQARKCQG